MKILDHLAQAAAVLLLAELLVVLVIFLAVAGGLAFGLRWVRGKTDWAFAKANHYLALATSYVDRGAQYAGRPFILAAGWLETARVMVKALEGHVRTSRRKPAVPTGAAPVAEPEQVEPLTLV